MGNPSLAGKIQKLIEAGIIRTGWSFVNSACFYLTLLIIYINISNIDSSNSRFQTKKSKINQAGALLQFLMNLMCESVNLKIENLVTSLIYLDGYANKR